MSQYLINKRIVLGVTGSIAAYKSAELARRLREAGAEVRVVMTEHAKAFITPLTMQAVSGQPVHDDLFDLQAEAAMGHIALARWAEVILIAPASADCLARLAHGQATDLLSTLCLATRAPLVVAPAMNQAMWQHTRTQHNVQVLQNEGVIFLGPDAGNQACGDVGPGRMLEPTAIIAELATLLAPQSLDGKTVVITAGPTQEAIDPIRYLSNHSSGKMGYALAQAAYRAGATVILISGPTALAKPFGVTCLSVKTANEMLDAVMKHSNECDIFIAVAAVADYRSETIAKEKIHKQAETLQLNLVRNPDIVHEVSQLAKKPFIVGFAAETEDVVLNAKAKRLRKNMDIIIANQVGEDKAMGMDDNTVTVIDANESLSLPCMSKPALAQELITIIANKFKQRSS